MGWQTKLLLLLLLLVVVTAAVETAARETTAAKGRREWALDQHEGSEELPS